MDRTDEIEAVVGFVRRHPESLVSRRILRETDVEFARDTQEQSVQNLRSSLSVLEDEAITRYYYLIR